MRDAGEHDVEREHSASLERVSKNQGTGSVVLPAQQKESCEIMGFARAQGSDSKTGAFSRVIKELQEVCERRQRASDMRDAGEHDVEREHSASLVGVCHSTGGQNHSEVGTTKGGGEMEKGKEGGGDAKERYCSWIPLDYGTVGAGRSRRRVKYTKTTAIAGVGCASMQQRTGGKGCGAFSVTTKTRDAESKKGEKYRASTVKQHVKDRSLTQISSAGRGAAVPAKFASSLLQAKKVEGAAVSTQVRVLKTSMEAGVRVASQTVKRKLWEKVPETTAGRLALADELRSRLHEVLTCENSCHNDGKNPHVSGVSSKRLQRCVAKNAGGTRGSGIRVLKAAGMPGTNGTRATVPMKERATVRKSRVSKTGVVAGILVNKVAEVGGLERDTSKSRLPILERRCARAEVSTGTVSAQRLEGVIVGSNPQSICALLPMCEIQVIADMTPNIQIGDRCNDVARALISQDDISTGTRVNSVRSAVMNEKGENVSSICGQERSISVMNNNSGGESPVAQILVQESSSTNEATPGTAFDTDAMLAVEAYLTPGACRCR